MIVMNVIVIIVRLQASMLQLLHFCNNMCLIRFFINAGLRK